MLSRLSLPTSISVTIDPITMTVFRRNVKREGWNGMRRRQSVQAEAFLGWEDPFSTGGKTLTRQLMHRTY